MARALRHRFACALLAAAALGVGATMPACGTDTIELLPLAGGGAGGAGIGGSAFGGAGSGNGGRGGDAAGGGGSSGAAGQGRGGTAGCSGFGCGGFGNDAGSGGEGFDCTERPSQCDCGPEGKCPFGSKCHPTERVCVPKCDGPQDCGGNGFVCVDFLCGRCSSNQQCDQYGTFQRHVCVGGLCSECGDKSDCPPERPLCGDGRCVECFDDQDCPDDEQCDELRGRCNK